MTEPNFSTFDNVLIEAGVNNTFRWTFDGHDWIDNGYTGEYLVGFVSEIDVDVLEVVCSIYAPSIGTDIEYVVPMFGHIYYRTGQWNLPGFLKLKEKKQTRQEECGCGSVAYYGKDTGNHSDYCKLYRKTYGSYS